MDPDPLKQAWQTQSSQTRLTIDADLLLKEVRRNQRNFTATIFWRDVREVGVALVLIPWWIYTGIKDSLPWTWFLVVPGVVWIAGFILVDRRRHRPERPESGEPLRQIVESSLAQVEHQIWLLRNVLWWYILPCAIPISAIFGQIAWKLRSGGWSAAFAAALMLAIVAVTVVGVYRINQTAIRTQLEPRRQELEALRTSLIDETPGS